jgi:hypothetical protein
MPRDLNSLKALFRQFEEMIGVNGLLHELVPEGFGQARFALFQEDCELVVRAEIEYRYPAGLSTDASALEDIAERIAELFRICFDDADLVVIGYRQDDLLSWDAVFVELPLSPRYSDKGLLTQCRC